MKSSLIKLIARIEDTPSSEVSLKDVRVLVKTGDPEVIGALAGLLDDDGRVGREAARGLAHFGRVAEPTLRRCLASSIDLVARRAADLLAALGDDEALRESEVVDQENEAAAVVAEQLADNDNEDVPAAELAHLSDPTLVQAVGRVLESRGIKRQDLGDGLAEVQMRILEILRIGPPPTKLDEWIGLAVRVAENFAFDVGRKKKARSKHQVDIDADFGADAYASEDESTLDRVDQQRLFGLLQELDAEGRLPPLAEPILEGQAEGKSDAEIAEELGTTRLTIRAQRRAIRSLVQFELARRGMSSLDPSRNEGENDDDENDDSSVEQRA